ncbi:hypothetical protein [Streptomyces sp. NBC_00198]|uniref:hypothetical protein n=1 Tax=unclassified Streptomyces TaxID=2593676 RepID=UPI002254E777|nr:hypothetical protein [Streptomyces sp. NBC_00198]MCX5280936.1 hypothetical protein [Streptomyces sp. NBC_00198]
MRAVEIPDYLPHWWVWIMLGLAALQAIGLVPISGRLRASDPAVRSEARLDLLDAVGALLSFGGFGLTLVGSASWFWLGLVGFALMTAGYAVKGVRLLRARRRPTG